MTATRVVDTSRAEMGQGREHSSKQRFFPSPFPLRDKGVELHTHPAIRSCIPACISLSPPRSDGLSCPSGPSPRLPDYLMRNSPYLLMMLGPDICVWSFQSGGRVKEGIWRGMFGEGIGSGEGGEGEGGLGRGRTMAG